MLDEIITLDEYVNIEEALTSFMNEKSLKREDCLLTAHSIKLYLDKMPSTKFNYLSWQTMDTLEETCTSHIMVNSWLITCIGIVLTRWPIHAEIAKYLVINNVPEHVYGNIRLYLIANSEEAKAVLTMGGL